MSQISKFWLSQWIVFRSVLFFVFRELSSPCAVCVYTCYVFLIILLHLIYFGAKSIWNHLVCCTFHAILIEWIGYSSNLESVSQMCLTDGVCETLESSMWHHSHCILGYSKRLRTLSWCVGCVWKHKWLCLLYFGNCFDSVSAVWGNRCLSSSLGKYNESCSSTFQNQHIPPRHLLPHFLLFTALELTCLFPHFAFPKIYLSVCFIYWSVLSNQHSTWWIVDDQ